MIVLFNSLSLKGKEVKDSCVQNKITCYDINVNVKGNGLILGRTDGHWNSKANNIIFNNLLPQMRHLVAENLSSKS